jgi:hypothetical protein
MFFKHSQPAKVSAPAPRPSLRTHQNADAQPQSPLFTRLPAELRNKVYKHLFTEDFPTHRALASKPHAFSLLLSCRRINHEAGTLAFKTYTFTLSRSVVATYLGVCSAVSHLRREQVHAISSLSVPVDREAGALLTNALLIFPHLARFSFQSRVARRQHRGGTACRLAHPPCNGDELDPAIQAVDKYAPHALVALLRSVASGELYAWQGGERWTFVWPQLESAYCYTSIQQSDSAATRPRQNQGGSCELHEELVMDDEAADEVDGVQMCVCGCANVVWTTAVLAQEGGRKVDVSIVYRSEPEVLQPRSRYVPKVTLLPGAVPASEVEADRTGFGFEVDDEYWEGMRRRNGDLGAMCRGLWKRAMAFDNESYSRLVAQSREAGDLV